MKLENFYDKVYETITKNRYNTFIRIIFCIGKIGEEKLSLRCISQYVKNYRKE